MIDGLRRGLPVTLLLVGFAGPGFATESLTLSPTQDSWINSNVTTQNNGAATTLNVRNRNGNIRNTLIQFSVSTVPSDATIQTGTLNLVVTSSGGTRTYGVYPLTQAWTESGVTWAKRDASNNWTTAGGTIGAQTTSASTGVAGTTVAWTVTTDVQGWFTGSTNNGWLIKDNTTTGSNSGDVTNAFGSDENATASNRPTLVVTYMRRVRDLTVTAGNGQNMLSWTVPGTGPAYAGTLIIRRAGAAPTSTPADATEYAIDAALADGSVVRFNDGALGTTFTDTGLTNGTTYHYQAFAKDSANRYSAAGGTVSSTPTTGTAPNAAWSYGTSASTLAPPGLDPGGAVIVGSNDNKVHSLNPANGVRKFAPFATGGAIQATPPVLDAGYSSLGVDVAYVSSGDGFLYAINTTTGAQIWKSAVQIGGTVQGGAAVWVQVIKPLTFTVAAGGTMTRDVVFVGSRNTDAGGAFNNKLYALNADTGTVVWTFNGTGSFSINIISSTPLIDYANNAIFFTSQLGTAGLPRQTLWKLDAATGTLQGGAFAFPTTLGSIDSSPGLSFDGNPPSIASSFLYTGNNAGQLIAVRLSDGTIFTHTPSTGTGALKGFPLSFGTSTPSVATPDTIIYARDTTLHAVTFDGATFGTLWGPVTLAGTPTLSRPIDFFDLALGDSRLYLGASDGTIHQINIATGTDEAQRTVPGTPGLGDASLDYTNNRLYLGATDGNIYAFDLPF
ncbi:MAG TPA: DNRLRE domain-containing protein [Methylomirabilota bacterium]|jgi:outer membrane protein assembly factor BamB|nr:DNRLRE domain-containing protein [Methylomirabilota bacterium]